MMLLSRSSNLKGGLGRDEDKMSSEYRKVLHHWLNEGLQSISPSNTSDDISSMLISTSLLTSMLRKSKTTDEIHLCQLNFFAQSTNIWRSWIFPLFSSSYKRERRVDRKIDVNWAWLFLHLTIWSKQRFDLSISPKLPLLVYHQTLCWSRLCQLQSTVFWDFMCLYTLMLPESPYSTSCLQTYLSPYLLSPRANIRGINFYRIKVYGANHTNRTYLHTANSFDAKNSEEFRNPL